jgi:23S rRNA (pseudouridine1915-N3)-methyltransferase
MRAAIPESAYIVALEVGGRRLSTEGLAEFLSKRLMEGRDLALLIGGPEGIEPELSQSAHFKWSLSDLTLPHALARVVLAEAIYRAHSVLKGHPYHRA